MSGMCVFILTRRGAQVAPAFLKKIASQRQILVNVLEGLVTFLEYSRHGMCYLLYNREFAWQKSGSSWSGRVDLSPGPTGSRGAKVCRGTSSCVARNFIVSWAELKTPDMLSEH